MALTLLVVHTEPYALASGFVQMRTDALPEASAYGSERYPRLAPTAHKVSAIGRQPAVQER